MTRFDLSGKLIGLNILDLDQYSISELTVSSEGSEL